VHIYDSASDAHVLNFNHCNLTQNKKNNNNQNKVYDNFVYIPRVGVVLVMVLSIKVIRTGLRPRFFCA